MEDAIVLLTCVSLGMLQAGPDIGWCLYGEKEILSRSREIFVDRKGFHSVFYYPKYGCLALLHTNEHAMVGSLFVTILGLDKYEQDGHPVPGGGTYDFIGRPTDFQSLPAGEIFVKDVNDIRNRFEQLLGKASQRKGDDRSSQGGTRQGHQFTPALILALWRQAIANDGRDRIPVGGFTDNGVHTGGQPRNTSFPLVEAFFRWALREAGDNHGSLFLRFSVYLDLRIMEALMNDVDRQLETLSAPRVRSLLDCAFRGLRDAAEKFSLLDEGIFHLNGLLDAAQSLRRRIEETARSLQRGEAQKYVLPDVDRELTHPEALRNPVLHLETGSPWDKPRAENLVDIRRRTMDNIGLLPVFECSEGSTFAKLLLWSQSGSLMPVRLLPNVWLVIRLVLC